MEKSAGYLEIIAGPMYSGKTEELIKRVRFARSEHKQVQVFKHDIDTRYGNDAKLYTHAGDSLDCEVIHHPYDIIKNLLPETEIVAIDEAQWFGEELVPVVDTLLEPGKKVIISGLALTYDRTPFPPMPTLMAMADEVTKLHAQCAKCGNDAIFHKKLTTSNVADPTIADPELVGAQDHYEARCRNCFEK